VRVSGDSSVVKRYVRYRTKRRYLNIFTTVTTSIEMHVRIQIMRIV